MKKFVISFVNEAADLASALVKADQLSPIRPDLLTAVSSAQCRARASGAMVLYDPYAPTVS